MRVIIQYNCIPHYRARIFELLSNYQDIDFSIVADSKPDTPHLKTITNEDGREIRFTEAKTHIFRLFLLPALYWQPRAVTTVWSENPDIIIALGSPYSITAWVLLLIGRIRKIPVLLWGHGLLQDEHGPKWWQRSVLYRLATGQLLYGERARELLVKKGFDENSLFVVYNSLDFDAQRCVASEIGEDEILAFRASLSVGANEGLVVFTGRLQKTKRLDLLIRALAALAAADQRVHVALVGEGDEEIALRDLAMELGLMSQVHFLGSSYDERFLGVVISASDASVIPSGAGLSVMHALVYGTPVILHDRTEYHGPEWEAVTERETGFFYHYGNIDDLSEKIRYCVFEMKDKTKMAADCKAVIEHKYNPHNQLDTFVRAVKWAWEAKRGRLL
ncbi:MAG: glycosyltransferase [Gammaproteobacteria bacterium]|nr:glycosyltransferase [Gammaproteobacteria bacterium]